MYDQPLFVLGILFFNIILCEWLVAKTSLRHMGTATLVIILTAIVANIGIIPSSSRPPVLYDHIFQYIAPLSIFYLLLECNISAIKSAGLPLTIMFLVGAAGTVVGVLSSILILGADESLGPFFPQIAGMFTGTYIGGSINFNAVALEYDITKEGNLYAGAVAIDNIWTAVWMVSTIVIPKFLSRFYPRKKQYIEDAKHLSEKNQTDTESVNPFHICILLVLGIFTLICSDNLSSLFSNNTVAVPSILILTTISLSLAQLKSIQKIRGGRVLGIIGIYLFLAVIGAYCDFSTIPQMGDLAIHLLLFVGFVVLIHGLFIFGIGALLKQDWDVISIASQANVGGSGSALALARSLDRPDLLLPAILIGTIGNALGSYVAFAVVAFYS